MFYEGSMIKSMMRHFKILLSNLLTLPDDQIGRINFLNQAEKDTILYNWNNTKVSYPKEKKCCSIISGNKCKKTPDSVALVFEGNQYSYNELDKLSNRFANYLINSFDINDKEFVGVNIDHSEWMIISILAILKLGGGICSHRCQISSKKDRLY